MYDTMVEGGQKYWVGNGPELMMVEMEKKLEGKTKKTDKKTLTEEEIEKIKKDAIAEEDERRSKLDEGVHSTTGKKKDKPKLSAELETKKAEILKRSGMSEKEFDESVKRRAKIGA